MHHKRARDRMSGRIGGRLSYANVMATLAVFIALGGGAWAVAIGRNDVGSREIAKNAVGGSELKDNKTKGKDVDEASLGQVPSAASADTATLAGTALQTFRDDSIPAPATSPGQNWTLLSATVPAGSYVLTGKATVDNNESTGPVEIRCFLRVGSQVLDRANLGLGISPGEEDIAPFMVTSVHTSAAPFTVVLECTNQGNAPGDTAAQDRKILAHPVASVVNTEATAP
jgi:hypothetical protein